LAVKPYIVRISFDTAGRGSVCAEGDANNMSKNDAKKMSRMPRMMMIKMIHIRQQHVSPYGRFNLRYGEV
jgi:hypothetical protein